MANEEWRIFEILKLLRQCVTCPQCGSLVATEAGIKAHITWHAQVNDKVNQIDAQFQAIDTYVRGPGGLESQITAAIAQLRVDAKAYTDLLRTDATNAIVALQGRVTALEARP